MARAARAQARHRARARDGRSGRRCPRSSRSPAGRRLALAATVADAERVPPDAALRLVRAYADAPGFEAVNRAMRAGRFTRLEHIRVPVTLGVARARPARRAARAPAADRPQRRAAGRRPRADVGRAGGGRASCCCRAAATRPRAAAGTNEESQATASTARATRAPEVAHDRVPQLRRLLERLVRLAGQDHELGPRQRGSELARERGRAHPVLVADDDERRHADTAQAVRAALPVEARLRGRVERVGLLRQRVHERLVDVALDQPVVVRAPRVDPQEERLEQLPVRGRAAGARDPDVNIARR